MATQNPLLPIGSYVQLNPSVDSPRAMAPSGEEQTIGIVRQAFTVGGQPYYQVVWNPGDKRPKVGMYHANELTCLSQSQAQDILNQLAAGTYKPSLPQQGSAYQQPNIPNQALPPALQGGSFAPGPADENQPTILPTG